MSYKIDVLEDVDANTEICSSGITVTGAYSATSRTPAPASQPTQSTVHATPKPSQTPSPTTSQSKSTAEEDGHTQQGHESAIESSHTIIDHAPSTWIASSEETTKTIGTNMPASNPVLTLGGSQYTRNSQSEIILPGLTLKPGQAATVSNTPISFDSAGSYAIVGTKTQSLTPAFAPDAPEAPAVLTIQGASYTVDQDSNHFVINGMTLHPGSTITVAGTPVALGPDGSYAVVGTKTQPLTVATLNGDAAPVIIVAGTPYTQQSDSGYIIAGQTLSKGGKITVAGSVVSWVSVRKSAAGDFSAGHFITAAPVASIQPKPVLTFGGSTYTARPDSHDFVIDGQTLTQGGEITVSGVDISYPTDSYIVVGSSTQQLGATRAAKLTFAGSTFTADAHGDFVIDGQTLTQGGEITVSDVGISYPTGSYIVVGSSTQQLETTGAAELTFAGSTFTADAYGDFVVEGQTLKPGGVINIDGTAISYATDGAGVIIGSETEFFAVPTGQEPTITFEGSTYTAGAASDFVIGGQTLTPGSAITVDGVPLSYAADGHDVVVGSQTQYFATDADYGSAITFEGSTYTANAAGDFVIAGQTLTPGGVITVDGTPISYDADGKDVVVGSETQYLATGTELGAAITFEGSTYTANVAGDFVIAGQTLTPGGVITVDGTPISYDSDGKDVVVGSETQYLATGTEFGATITFEGSTYTANVAGDFVIAGETLTPGGVITVDGTPISYAADESDVVVGTSTEAVGLGSYIIGGFGSGFGTATTAGGSNYTGAVFAGRAAGQYDSLLSWRGVVLVGSVVIVSITL
ncbi:MAG: hypothetical protein HETSPECPRED_007999 [Heterodermia speciosa]|uniref:Uncharacterized protein n=1 Tax=Heterodermia speciosa TaxID=116794 RepID=A0A8H3EMH7_9LECA|nr:MAG: hypothetical protein HETSPECPRED_007999 [Heterodermia speciosa]